MNNCRLCDEASDFYYGIKGNNADNTKLLFILHKPDSRITENCLSFADPYLVALAESATGRNLGRLLSQCKLSLNDIFLTNLFKCTLPEDRNPKKLEYQNCLILLNNQIEEFNPKKIVVCGRKAYEILFPQDYIQVKDDSSLATIHSYKEIPSFILPHPSRMQIEKIGREKYNLILGELKEFLGVN